jgi:hypothetical protein
VQDFASRRQRWDVQPKKPKLLDRMTIELKARHYSPRTIESYVWWAKRYSLFHHKRHPSSMGADEANVFLPHLAVDGHVSAATQNQALSALLFLYRHVLDEPLPWLKDLVRAKRPISSSGRAVARRCPCRDQRQ